MHFSESVYDFLYFSIIVLGLTVVWICFVFHALLDRIMVGLKRQ